MLCGDRHSSSTDILLVLEECLALKQRAEHSIVTKRRSEKLTTLPDIQIEDLTQASASRAS